jgi:hypothetical protein
MFSKSVQQHGSLSARRLLHASASCVSQQSVIAAQRLRTQAQNVQRTKPFTAAGIASGLAQIAVSAFFEYRSTGVR